MAVRSSAVAEDSDAASYAGQQDTFLHVAEPRRVLACADCWASWFGERALYYRSRKGSLGDLRMAVVVQRMVDPDVAGVMFTVDPVSGRSDQMVVESVFGLGESVVAGTVTPTTTSSLATAGSRPRLACSRTPSCRRRTRWRAAACSTPKRAAATTLA